MEYTRNSTPLSYPSSGAFTHLPIRQTIIGSPALPHPNANKIFLRNLPAHCYTLPAVSLNFTLVEILVLLPNWFKNKVICSRFMNNNLTAHVHFMIMEEHRDLALSNEYEREKARKTLTDEYRKAMRSLCLGWTKAKHTAPADWDPWFMSLDGFVPDDVRLTDYRRPTSIPFRELMQGVKKIPQGVHAGDLSRALEFALGAQYDLYFPDDLSSILEHIGRTQITVAHTDRSIVRRYVEKKHFTSPVKQSRSISEPKDGTDSHGSFALPQPQAHQAGTTTVQEQTMVPQDQAQPYPGYRIEQSNLTPPPRMVIASTKGQAAKHVTSPAYFGISVDEMELEAMLREHLDQDTIPISTPPASSLYDPKFPLRDCIEGDLAFDGSPLARAARFAQRPNQLQKPWCVEDVPWLIDLLNAAQLENSS